MIQLHPYCHICSCHQFNNLESFIGNFYSMCRFHLSCKLHQQVCQYVAISSIWFIFIHVTSSLKLFHLIKLMLSNFIDLVRSAPLFCFVFYPLLPSTSNLLLWTNKHCLINHQKRRTTSSYQTMEWTNECKYCNYKYQTDQQMGLEIFLQSFIIIKI